jgi:hypothetical protein
MSPSILETPPQPKDGTRPRRRGQPTRPRLAELTIHDTVPLHPTALPAGATFQGFEAYVVQDLAIESVHTKYERARYELPEGGSVLPPLPAGVLPVAGRHFGANLIASILDQYHQAHVTEPVRWEQLGE